MTRIRKRARTHMIGLAVLATAFSVGPDPLLWITGNGAVSEAEARVGRPATPVSVAGVARRTTRRVVRRTATYISVLPAGCATVSINGAGYYQCGGTYYQSYGGQYVVVIID